MSQLSLSFFLSLSLSFSHSLRLSHSLTPSFSHSFILSFSLSLSLSPSFNLSLVLSFSLLFSHSVSLALLLSSSLALSLFLYFSNNATQTLLQLCINLSIYPLPSLSFFSPFFTYLSLEVTHPSFCLVSLSTFIPFSRSPSPYLLASPTTTLSLHLTHEFSSLVSHSHYSHSSEIPMYLSLFERNEKAEPSGIFGQKEALGAFILVICPFHRISHSSKCISVTFIKIFQNFYVGF